MSNDKSLQQLLSDQIGGDLVGPDGVVYKDAYFVAHSRSEDTDGIIVKASNLLYVSPINVSRHKQYHQHHLIPSHV